ncbi:hypothetical protein B0H11DRAFT_2189580 [Mycena galericulata]|nr:hypothetical protein B0H11DRAFT_2189580 [Mycena galericulata]
MAHPRQSDSANSRFKSAEQKDGFRQDRQCYGPEHGKERRADRASMWLAGEVWRCWKGITKGGIVCYLSNFRRPGSRFLIDISHRKCSMETSSELAEVHGRWKLWPTREGERRANGLGPNDDELDLDPMIMRGQPNYIPGMEDPCNAFRHFSHLVQWVQEILKSGVKFEGFDSEWILSASESGAITAFVLPIKRSILSGH